MRIRLLGVLLLLSLPAGAVPLAQVQATLWPRASYAPTLMVKGAQGRALAAYGTGPDGTVLDIGALRETGGQAEILTPSGWMLYSEREHRGAANAYARVGPGWSWGNNSIHSSGRGWFANVYGMIPTPMQAFDLQYDGTSWETLKHWNNDGLRFIPPVPPALIPRPALPVGDGPGPPPPPPTQPPPPVVTPPPPPPPSPPICPACPPSVVCPTQTSVVCPLVNRLAKEFACLK